MDDQDKAEAVQEESPARKRAVRSCDNAEHSRLLQWHDLWRRTVSEHDNESARLREALKSLEHKLLAAEAEVRLLRLMEFQQGSEETRRIQEAKLRQAREREAGWREEFAYVRKEWGLAIDRAIAAEERTEQGLMRETQMIRHLETLTNGYLCYSFTGSGSLSRVECRNCAGWARGSVMENVEHTPTCPVGKAEEDVRHWQKEGGVLRHDTESEMGRLRRAVVMLGLDRLGQCPGCEADRTNGEWHKDGCSLLPILAEYERKRAT